MKKSTEMLADGYRAFARHEAHGISPTYETYAMTVAENTDLLGRLLDLPDGKQQPNLLFAATRHSARLPDEGFDFAQHALTAWDAVRSIILSRSTQTTSPGAALASFRHLPKSMGHLLLSRSELRQAYVYFPTDTVTIMAAPFCPQPRMTRRYFPVKHPNKLPFRPLIRR